MEAICSGLRSGYPGKGGNRKGEEGFNGDTHGGTGSGSGLDITLCCWAVATVVVKMTKERALTPARDALRQSQELFSLGFVKMGATGTSAAREAGYKHPRSAAQLLLQNPLVIARIQELRDRLEDDAIADEKEQRKYMTTFLRSDDEETIDRIRAAAELRHNDEKHIKTGAPSVGVNVVFIIGKGYTDEPQELEIDGNSNEA